jgi:hypothetical protein
MSRMRQTGKKETVVAEPKVAESGPNPVREYYRKMQNLYWRRKKEEKESVPKKKWKPAPDHPWRRNLCRR